MHKENSSSSQPQRRLASVQRHLISTTNSTDSRVTSRTAVASLQPKALPVIHTDSHKPKLALVMVGLPFRGKSMLATRLVRYLTWMGYPTKLFATPKEADREGQTNVLQGAVRWLESAGRVAILDDYNATRKIRASIRVVLEQQSVDVLFIESYCSDDVVLKQIFDTKMQTVKYSRMGVKKAKVELQKRIAAIARVYESMEGTVYERDCPFLKVVNQGQQIIMNLCWGYLPGQISLFLANQHTGKRKIWLSRHGQSEYNVLDKLGGDSGLTLAGIAYSYALADFFNSRDNLTVYTSTLVRTHQTIQLLEPRYRYHQTRLLNEIDAGSCEHLTYDEIKEKLPEEYLERMKDKFHYRYPKGGESYVDLVERLKPYIIELERQRDNVLVVSHQAVMRVVLSYFLDALEQSECPTYEIPHNRIVELTPTAYGYQSNFIDLDIKPYLEKLKSGQLPLGPAFLDKNWRPPGYRADHNVSKADMTSSVYLAQDTAEDAWVADEWSGKLPREKHASTDIR